MADSGTSDSGDLSNSGNPLSGEQHVFEVSPEEAGLRLDVFLHRRVPDSSRSSLKRLVEEGRVSIDDRSTRASRMLRVGERVSLKIPPPPPPLPIPQEIDFDLIYEDETLLVIDKPAGLVVHPGAGNHSGGTLVNALLSHTDQLSREAGDYRPGIVHRLDRETSGLIVIARNDDAHRRLAAQFKARIVKKEYLALAHGAPLDREGTIDAPLGRSLVDRKKIAIRHDNIGKRSITQWRTIGTLGKFTWFRCFPVTGRTHQIRVHLKSIGHPIACDYHYGRERELTLSDALRRKPQGKELPLLERHALHAFRIALRHPEDGRPLQFEAPLSPDLDALWSASAIDQEALDYPPPVSPSLEKQGSDVPDPRDCGPDRSNLDESTSDQKDLEE